MTNARKKVVRYSFSFKQQVVKEIECEGMTLMAARRRYGIKGAGTIRGWLIKFGKKHLLNQVIRVETMDEKERVKLLEKEIMRLKLALADSLLAQRGLEVVIDEANKEYGTDLKKNFGESVLNDSEGSSV